MQCQRDPAGKFQSSSCSRSEVSRKSFSIWILQKCQSVTVYCCSRLKQTVLRKVGVLEFLIKVSYSLRIDLKRSQKPTCYRKYFFILSALLILEIIESYLRKSWLRLKIITIVNILVNASLKSCIVFLRIFLCNLIGQKATSSRSLELCKRPSKSE